MYFEPVILRLFPDAMSITEDWRKKVVSFQLLGTQVEVDLQFVEWEDLLRAVGSQQLRIKAIGDTRNSDRLEGRPEALVTITIKDVQFPAQPE